ncbi:MAG TPA: flagellar basal body-associated FliL family protein [Gemmatimonadaceae bacterium]|nr:flagellar basal body-associated FliL family protein [Gemmatimonadaceae bacterium]
MATQAIEQIAEAPEADAAAPAKKGGRTVLIMAVAGVLAGSAAGLFGVGPVLAKRRAAVPAAPKAAEEHVALVSHPIENLVLNPAGSGGTRFLMVTAAFQLKDGATEQLMKDREPEVRDHILALLGRKTVEELSDIMQREKIKKEVLDAVAPLFPPGTVLKLFFPQFVIQ